MCNGGDGVHPVDVLGKVVMKIIPQWIITTGGKQGAKRVDVLAEVEDLDEYPLSTADVVSLCRCMRCSNPTILGTCSFV